MLLPLSFSHYFFFNDTATSEIYTLSLHDALPILGQVPDPHQRNCSGAFSHRRRLVASDAGRLAGSLYPRGTRAIGRSEEHTSELQSRRDLVCRLLLEKKKPRLRKG